MVKIKIKSWVLILVSILFLVSLAHSLDLSVQISDTVDYRYDDFESEKNDQLISSDFSVENTGSISCLYQAAAVFNYSNSESEVWSTSESLMPGESTTLEIHNAFPNTTGQVEGQVSITFCENERTLETEEFEINSSTDEHDEIESLTMEASDREAGITLDIDQGLLVPVRSQGMWRLSSHEITGGQTRIKYRPEVYSEQAHEYYVVQDGEVTGITEVDLSERPSLGERVRNFRYYLSL